MAVQHASAIAGGRVQAQDVGVVYRSRKGPVTAIEHINLTIEPGEFVSVVGPSGCGKSTLIKVFSGLLWPSSGTVTIDATPVDKPRGDVGIVFQQPTLLPWKNVLENVLVPLRAQGRADKNSVAKAMDMLRLVGLEKFAEHQPTELSGGMQQRVGIARGLLHDPNLLLMDEPFSALDTMTRDHMAQELQRIWMMKRTSALFITHSIQEAVFLSDRVVVMSARPGKIVREIQVDLPRPRTLDVMASERFGQLCGELRTLFEQIVHFD